MGVEGATGELWPAKNKSRRRTNKKRDRGKRGDDNIVVVSSTTRWKREVENRSHFPFSQHHGG